MAAGCCAASSGGMLAPTPRGQKPVVAQVDKLATLGIRLTDLVARQGTLDDKEYASVQAQLDEAAKTQDELVIAAVHPLEKLLRATKVE